MPAAAILCRYILATQFEAAPEGFPLVFVTKLNDNSQNWSKSVSESVTRLIALNIFLPIIFIPILIPIPIPIPVLSGTASVSSERLGRPGAPGLDSIRIESHRKTGPP